MNAVVLESSENSIIAQLRVAIADDLRFLARLHLHEVDGDLLSALKQEGFPAGLGLRLNSQPAQEALQRMTEVMAALPDPVDAETLDFLAVDFANIYLLYTHRASPYESVWLDEEQLERQLPMFQVSAEYRKHELVAADRGSIPDDHLGLQLEFLAYLLERVSGQDGLIQTARFMDDHLLRWLDRFAQCVAARSGTSFYAGLALLTASYCDELRELLVQILDQPRPTAEAIELRMKPNAQVQETPLKFVPGATPSW